MNGILKKYAEAKKAQRKKFGTFTAFILALAVIECFSFSGSLLSIVTSSYLYGIPEYVAFVLIVTLCVYLSSQASQLYEKKDNYNQLAAITVVSAGLALILIQMVMGYLAEVGLIKKPYNSSLSFIFAFMFIDEVVGTILSIVPNYLTARQHMGRLKRIGIAFLSLTALPILFLGWILGHVVTSQLPAAASGISLLMTSSLALGLLVFLIGKIQLNWQSSRLITHTWLPTTLFLVALGLLNGSITGSPASIEDPLVSSTLTKIVLSAMLGSQIITTLTIWYLFVVLPYFYPKRNSSSSKA